ncbi:MAG: anti-sigma factor antagonist [Planctomycetes bacterium]|nr:anti-sigma factor antagonist [Planctomycetota bacterium]
MSIAAEINVGVEEIVDGIVIRPVGVIDIRNAAMLKSQLEVVQSRNPNRLVVDLTDVPEIDSSALAVLVEAIGVSRQSNALLILCGLQERVRSLFDITRLSNKIFTIVDTVQQAKAMNNRRAEVRFNPKDLKCDIGELIDISAGGLRLISKRKLKGTVTLRLWNDVSGLVLQAAVVWSKKIRMRKHESGLEFINLKSDTMRELALLVATVASANSVLDT